MSSRGIAAWFYDRLAEVCLRRRWYGLAAGAYEQIVRIVPDDRFARSRHAWTLLHLRHRRNEGIHKLRLLLLATPDSDGFAHLGYALWEEHRYEEALHAYREAVRLSDSPTTGLQFNVGAMLSALGRSEEAVEAYREALRLNHPDTARLHCSIGDNLAALGRFDEALDAYEAAVQLDPSSGEAWAGTGSTLLDLGRLDEAVKACRSAVQLNPSDGESWARLGIALATLGSWTEAADSLKRAMRLTPDLIIGIHLGHTLYELNRLEEAERVLRDTLALDSAAADDQALKLTIGESLARVVSDQGRHDEAIALAREICSASPALGSPRAVLASVLCEAGRREEALAEATAALSVAPTAPECLSHVGGVYLDLNDAATALEIFDRMAASLEPESSPLPSSPWIRCLAGRADALSLLGRHHEAIAAFDEVRRIYPGYLERRPEFAADYARSSRETGREPTGGVEGLGGERR